MKNEEESVMDSYRLRGEPQYGGLLSEHLFELTQRRRGLGHIFSVRDST